MNFTQFLLMAAPTATTTGDGTPAGNNWASLLMTALPLVAMVVAMYFLIIRPQKKKEKEEKKMRENLQVGDEILTIGGIYGRVISLKEDAIVIESKSDHSKLTIARWAMQQNLTVHEDAPSK